MTLAEWVAAHKLTHAAAADLLGVSQAYMTMLIHGRRKNPRVELLQRIHEVTDGDVTLHDFPPDGDVFEVLLERHAARHD